METIYLVFLICLFILAIFDLSVGVTNDASNFLNSALGAKAASFRTVMVISALGILIGATLSNGMMDVARHGIYQPQHFYFTEIMCILLAVMLTDMVLLDIFNSLGLPTSTTVSLVFELLGASVAVALVKISNSNGLLNLGELLNTEKAFTMILAIFLSVAIAFLFGMIVQFLTRIIFTFNYKKQSKYFAAVFAGAAATAIVYFMLIKGLKDVTFMTAELKASIYAQSEKIVLYCFVAFTILMQILYWLKVNVFKVIVLLGTFSLALAFAGNDLVNFIGIPMAAYSSYIDLVSQSGAVSPDTFLMESLTESAETPWYFLVGAGVIMVISLTTSKKVHNVVKTSIDLSRQKEGTENFGTSSIARKLVRTTTNMFSSIISIIPPSVLEWIDSRFVSVEVPEEEKGVSFDMVRASVNVVLAALLIALGTSFKLPLSTTYVAFMVAMGTSLADRAWGRESAVYRITGVIAVVAGWFITAGAAFLFCFVVALIIYFGGFAAMIGMVGIAIYILIHSHLMYKKRQRKAALQEEVNSTVEKLQTATDTNEALALFRELSRNELNSTLLFAKDTLYKVVRGFMDENLKDLRQSLHEIEEKKIHIKQVKRVGTLGVSQLDHDIAVEKGLYYYQGNDFSSELIYSIRRMAEPCRDHIDNHFNPLSDVQKQDLGAAVDRICDYLQKCADKLIQNDYSSFKDLVHESSALTRDLVLLNKEELRRLQGQTGSTKVSMVYLNMIQETKNVVLFSTNLMKVSRKFQIER
ncbi:inorganic phosphate transporter [Massilibacteroides sp.]|uniref:inorganic phosphate transporter n=1 Tax=Massilibacteroides sp. TaxID=2034766 RepID=UPI00261BAA4F|nr:inorganic phosphate transporter [Massilibacteroides sp.]MDD4515283.1 inorganic phosphate transporter [Massilibacteroides sp.]